MSITTATTSDIPQIEQLVNSAYRGESSRKGWATEAALLSGEKRIDAAELETMMQQPGAVILKYTAEDDSIIGCVYLHRKEEGLYLGLLTVNPLLQAGGIGKKLLAAADDMAKEKGCTSVFMTVISQRETLVSWYMRHGYQPTGETKPFIADEKFGIPTQPLEFIVLKKQL